MPVSIHDMLERLSSYGSRTCLADETGSWTYDDLGERVERWRSQIGEDVVGRVVGLEADYGVEPVAAELALWSLGAIVALVPPDRPDPESYRDAGGIETFLRFDENGSFERRPGGPVLERPLLDELRAGGKPGLILFSSGSAGAPKAALHDVSRFLGKFERPGKALVTAAFLLFDHVAGQDTLLYTLNAGGALAIPRRRQPLDVCRLIERHRVQVLPASPTFFNLLLASGDLDRYDLSSVEIITYGSEPMAQATLERLAAAFPQARIIQKYGTTEFGALRSRSRADDSLFISIKKDETEVRVVDGILWVRSPGTMLGYLNAPSPFEEDGWLNTGDMVEERDGWLRILGRESDLINVGGEKVTPAEVEAVIGELPFVVDAVVRGEPNALLGMVVTTEVSVDRAMPDEEVRRRVLDHCRQRLARHKVPMKVAVSQGAPAATRLKKMRRPADE